MGAQISLDDQACSRCGEMQPLENYYFVSKKLGTRRRQCKACMSELKQAQKDPNWKPRCARCGRERSRTGPGRRLCSECFDARYDAEARRENGAHRERLKPCSACGAKRLRADHTKGASLCPVCRSVPQSRRKRLREFNLNPREFLALLEAQNYRCAICKRKPRKPLHIDHQHAEPMIVRGLVDARCNTLLALARDSTIVLDSASNYLLAPPAQEMFAGRVATVAANRGHVPLRRVA